MAPPKSPTKSAANPAPARGRRPGSPDTRADIVDAARNRFASAGFGATSLRAIAADAGVDPALVSHYFADKQALFAASLRVDMDVRLITAEVVDGGVKGAGERLMRMFIGLWEDDATRASLLALIKGIGEEQGQRLVRDWLFSVVLEPMGEALGLDRPRLRMALVSSQMIGLATVRYVLRSEPLAAMSAEALVAAYAPTLQRYLEVPLD